MTSKAKTQSDREQRLRENYHSQRSLYLEMKKYRDEWQRRAVNAESELNALRDHLRRLSDGWEADRERNKGRRARNKACQSDTPPERSSR